MLTVIHLFTIKMHSIYFLFSFRWFHLDELVVRALCIARHPGQKLILGFSV